ncbi:MAG: hypothetical protein P1U56_20345 [Saprospiraceae bacterium]|nr:hypothetical protein [Saprospiraceae bacterium]
MNIKEIRESGLLEQYAMGVLSEKEVGEVEEYLTRFPELKQEYLEIQNALQALANENPVQPRASLENEIIDAVLKESPPRPTQLDSSNVDMSYRNKPTSSIWKWLTGLFVFSTLMTFYFLRSANTKYVDQVNQFNAYKIECDSIARTQQESIEIFNQLNERNNTILNIQPTAAYPETQLLFHFNPIEKRNFIQIRNLPDIASNQAFQLWSLKPDLDPIPMNVFKLNGDFIIPVDFEDGTATYAITIEDEAGALVPTLDRLIGTIGV